MTNDFRIGRLSRRGPPPCAAALTLRSAGAPSAIRRKRREWASLSVLLLAGLMPLRMFAAETAGSTGAHSLDGTWKLAHPQTLLTPAGGGSIPFTEEGKKQYEANKAAVAKGDYSFDSTMTRCSSPGLPRLMLSADRFRVFQRPTIVTFMFEWNRLARQIDLPSSATKLRKSLSATGDFGVGTMKGITHGHWEGTTLVAESHGFMDSKLIDNLIVGSDQLKLVEHITLRDKDTLEDRITLTDPDTFTRSWDTVLTYKRVADEAFPEDVCLDRRDAGQPTWPK